MNKTLNNFPIYSIYRIAETEHTGKLPFHWKTKKGKWIFQKKDRPTRPFDDVITCFRDGQVTLRKNRRTEGFTDAIQEHGYQGVRRGDLVIHAMDAFAGAIGVSDSDGKSSPVYSVCTPKKPNDVAVRYYAYFLRNMALSGYLTSLAKGIRERSTDFRYKDFSSLELPLPPLVEQNRITRFLDQKISKINNAISVKEQQINLLKEHKKVLIQNAVTRGLDPDAPMRNSGIEWIGSIPEHWQIKRLKNISKFITSGPRGWSEFFSENGAYFLQSGNLNDSMEVVLHEAVRVVPKPGSEGLRTRLSNNDVLVCITGAKTGKVALSDIGEDQEVYINQHLCLARLDDTNEPAFVALILYSLVGQTYFFLQQYGLKQGLGLDDVKEAPILIPPRKEQVAIIEFINQQSAKIDKAIVLFQGQIERLKEYRATLIDSAVTGKIRVPGVEDPARQEAMA